MSAAVGAEDLGAWTNGISAWYNGRLNCSRLVKPILQDVEQVRTKAFAAAAKRIS